MDDTVKLTTISVVLGLIAGVISAVFTLGWVGITNDYVGLLIGIIIIYALFKLADNIAEEELGTSQKVWDCFMPFFFVWVIVWTLMANYM